MAKSRNQPSRRLLIWGIATALAVAAAFSAVPAQAASLHLVFPQSVEVTVVQGQSTAFTMEVQAFGATGCSDTTAPVRVDTLYSVNAAGEAASGVPADMPITTDQNRGVSENCYIHNPVLVPLTATAAASTPVGDYTTVIRYGKGGDGGVDLNGPTLTIHVIPPTRVVPPPVFTQPEIIVLGEKKAAPRPTLGETVLLNLVQGEVRFKIPGGKWTPLGDEIVVPNGTVIDAAKGVVKVTVERDATGALDSADVWGTGFKVNQPKGRRPITTFTLAAVVADARKVARAAAFLRSRSLWVNAKGNFRTRGKRASAIVRGTFWVTSETDAGTKIRVNRGLVAVRDFVKKQTVLVAAGQSYLARPRQKLRPPSFTG